MHAGEKRPEQPIPPECAAWLLYAGILQGWRWRRHLAARPVPVSAQPPRQPGPVGR